jgi:lipid-binding SYLF domain-containing protein
MRREARAGLNRLYSTSPAARSLGKSARGILVFPGIVKAGLLVGGQHGDGTLFVDGRAAGYYKSIAASYGLQAGVQKFGYALFFMTDGDLAYLRKSNGWEIGSGPSLVVVDQGIAKALSSTTLRKGVYAFTFGQRGLMGGVGLQGTKVSPIHPK